MNKINDISLKKYFEIQLSLEGLKIHNNKIYRVITDHFEVEKRVNQTPPLMIILKIDGKEEYFYSEVLSDEIVSKLEKIINTNQNKKIKDLLNKESINIKIVQYITYIFPRSFNFENKDTKIYNNSNDIKIKEFDESFYKIFPKACAVLKEDKVVSCCVSAREDTYAGEAWIYTLPDYRGKGYGITAVKLWAKDLIDNNKIPFYSHEISNTSSKKLAEKLNLIKVFELVVYE